ncbi:hypothetical protein [Kribbella speibonae]|uniref:Uncharacterized protein n=1 Tax=Kribbella speibonae TaxID=1572660 RepID=A0A4R0ITE2_9ACTN|nr:hypothetical protein [Kribbella speibonae]TCC36377.1 hypothetical protein E0H92_27430 [Kribbella speibonae]
MRELEVRRLFDGEPDYLHDVVTDVADVLFDLDGTEPGRVSYSRWRTVSAPGARVVVHISRTAADCEFRARATVRQSLLPRLKGERRRLEFLMHVIDSVLRAERRAELVGEGGTRR